MNTNEDFKVKVCGIDRITGRENWETTLNSLIEGNWPFDDDDIEALNNGKTVKLYSPNGRRVIDVTKID